MVLNVPIYCLHIHYMTHCLRSKHQRPLQNAEIVHSMLLLCIVGQ